MQTWELFIDGASRGNPGPAGVGVYIQDKETGEVIAELSGFIGKQTNNTAEYSALLYGLYIMSHSARYQAEKPKLAFYADSELLVKQINGIYRVKTPHIRKLYEKIYRLKLQTPFSISHVRREYNKEADRLANEGVDEKTPLPDSFRKILES